MLFAKKKAGAPSAPSAKPTGLFIDRDARATADIIDVPAVEVDDAVEVVGAAPASAPIPEAPRAASGFGALRVKKASAVGAEGSAANASEAKTTGLTGLRARFASKKPVEPASVMASSSDEGPNTASAGFSSAKPGKAEKPAKAVKTKKVAAPKLAKFGGKAEKRLVLLTELDNGRSLYWTLEADKLSQTDDVPQGSAVYSFSKEDFRFRAEGSLTYRQANDLALQEVGEQVQVVNRSKDLQAVYAARQERVLEARHLIIPAQQALDRLLLERKKDGQSLICGFYLKDGSDAASIAVLFHVSPDGEASKAQISVNPDSMEFVIAQFSATRKVDKATTEVLLFDNAELLTAIAGAIAFPNEPVWRGVPVRQVLSMVAVGALAVSVGLGGWAGYEYQQLTSLKAKQARLQQDIAMQQKKMTSLILGSVPEFANAMSLDVPALMARAQQVYLPETRLTMTADLTAARYDLWMPVARTATYNNRPTALNPVTVEQQHQLVNYIAPEGCERTPVGATGALNETQLTVTCETGNSALAAYRND